MKTMTEDEAALFDALNNCEEAIRGFYDSCKPDGDNYVGGIADLKLRAAQQEAKAILDKLSL